MAPRPFGGQALCALLLVAAAVVSDPTPDPRHVTPTPSAAPKAPATSTAAPTSDSLELAEDKDFMYEDLLSLHPALECLKPSCECRTAGSGGIAARCTSLDWKDRHFEGVINHLEVKAAPRTDDGLFLVHHSLASMGLKYLTTVKIVNSSLAALNVSTFDGLDELYEVDLSDNQILLTHPNTFLKNTQLRKLSLAGNPLRLLEMAGSDKHLLNSPSLQELDLSRCELLNLSPATFAKLPHLEHLWLAGNKLSTMRPGTLSALELLEELDLSDNNIGELTTEMFQDNAELTELHLRNNSLQSLSGVSIAGLDTLDISQNCFEVLENDSFAGFRDLTRLNASGNSVHKVHPRAFNSLVLLQFLDLSANDLQGPLPSNVFSANDGLETLNLSDNPSMGSLPLGGFRGEFSSLYQLDLSYTGLNHLDENSFLGMDHLATLYLQGNRLNDLQPGVLLRLSQLVTLDLSENNITSLDVKTFQTNGNLRRLILAKNPLTTVSPMVFAGLPYLKWLDLSRCSLTSLWEGPLSGRNTMLRRLGHLNIAGNRIQTLRVSELVVTGDLVVLDIENNPLKCSKELHYLMDWLVQHGVNPRSERRLLHGDLVRDSDEIDEEARRSRWAAVYNAVCGNQAYEIDRANMQKSILSSDASAMPPVTQADLDNINAVLGNKNLISTVRDEEDDGETDSEEDSEDADADDADDDSEDSEVEEADDDDDEDEDDVYDDSALADSTDIPYSSTHRVSPYVWPIITISVSLFTLAVVVANVVVCLLRRSRARRHLRYQSPMFRHLGNLPPQPKTFGGIPGSFIKTKKDGGFVYKKLYEDTTTPNQPMNFSQPRTFRFPLDPSDVQSSTAGGDPSRV